MPSRRAAAEGEAGRSVTQPREGGLSLPGVRHTTHAASVTVTASSRLSLTWCLRARLHGKNHARSTGTALFPARCLTGYQTKGELALGTENRGAEGLEEGEALPSRAEASGPATLWGLSWGF